MRSVNRKYQPTFTPSIFGSKQCFGFIKTRVLLFLISQYNLQYQVYFYFRSPSLKSMYKLFIASLFVFIAYLLFSALAIKKTAVKFALNAIAFGWSSASRLTASAKPTLDFLRETLMRAEFISKLNPAPIPVKLKNKENRFRRQNG